MPEQELLERNEVSRILPSKSQRAGTEAADRASGDFDRDGINDVAVVLVRGDSGVIVWLRGVSSGYASPLPIDSLSWASNGGLFTNHDTLGFGVFYSDVFRSWAWDSAARALRPASHTPGSLEP